MTNERQVKNSGVTIPCNSSAVTAPLLAQREAFAVAFVELRSATAAYRRAYNCAGMKAATVRHEAYQLRHAPDVAARVRELYAEAAEGTIVDTRSRMVALQEIVDADPSELVRVVAEACRRCHGIGHRWQWIDHDEFAEAWARALDDGEPLPSDAGGYGYSHEVAPAPGCHGCHGNGVTRVVVTPTDELSPAARRLLKGVRQKASGEITVMMHDQLAAADQLNKMAGVYIDRSVSLNVNANVPDFRDIVSDPAKALDFLESIAPTKPATVDVTPTTDHEA